MIPPSLGERPKIGGYDAIECVKPEVALIGVRHIQTDHGPADLFADYGRQAIYMRVWLNRDGLDELVWYRLEVKEAV